MDAKEFQKVFRENSLLLHGHPNHFGVLRLRPSSYVGQARLI